MPGPLPAGPWKTLPGPGGTSVPFYIVTFDEDGTCTSPATRDHLVGAAAGATDVFLFSHGWNNDWATATGAYDQFVSRYVPLRQSFWDPPTRPYRPVLVGVFWPSAVLVWPDERGPDFAGAEGPDDAATAQALAEMAAVAARVVPGSTARFYELAQRDGLTDDEAHELATILAPALAGPEDEVGPAAAPTPEDLLGVWRDVGQRSGNAPARSGGFIDDEPGAAAAPQVAGLLDWLKPRDIIRAATVLLMKDRAGRVGAAGVGDLLRRLVGASPDSRVRLVGHSYGGKVVLSALSAGPAPGRLVESVLLLQPAMSALCFAPAVPGGGAGGYRPALDRVRQPLMTTFSAHDFPLTKAFHWAVRRPSDLGEAVIAGLPVPPSRYAALGGYGPQGVGAEVDVVAARTAPNPYDVEPGGRRIIAVEADDVISSHGDVQNDATAWALLCQVMG